CRAGQLRRKVAHKGLGRGICWLVGRGRGGALERIAISKPRPPRQIHGRGQQEAKAGSLSSLGEARDALGRARPEAAPENHVSIDPSRGECGRLTPLPRPAQSDGHDAGAPSCRFRPRREKIAGSPPPACCGWAGGWWWACPPSPRPLFPRAAVFRTRQPPLTRHGG